MNEHEDLQYVWHRVTILDPGLIQDHMGQVLTVTWGSNHHFS